MSEELEQLRFSQWILERHLGWIAASDAKAAVAVTIDSAMLGVLVTAFSALKASERTAWANLFTTFASVCLLLALICIALALLPRLNGPKSSNIYCACISKNSNMVFLENFKKLSVQDMLNDCLAQIHRNAEIATDKFQYVRKGMVLSFLAIPFWLLALINLV